MKFLDDSSPLEFKIFWVRNYKNCVVMKARHEIKKTKFGVDWEEIRVKIVPKNEGRRRYILANFHRGDSIYSLNGQTILDENDIPVKVTFD